MVKQNFLSSRHAAHRQGNLLVLTAICMVIVFAFLAFSIDIGLLVTSRADLQTASDAAARSAARYLPQGIDNVEQIGEKYAETNLVSNKSIRFYPDEDLQIGNWNFVTREFTSLDKSQIESANAVQATVRMNAERGNSENLFFAPMLGIQTTNMQAHAIAAIESNIRGFKKPEHKKTHPILPFAIDLFSWDLISNGTGTDNHGYDETSESVSAHADGQQEINLFPSGNHAAGNRGYLNIGADGGSNSTLRRQIKKGLTPSDFDFHGGSLDLGENSTMTVGGQPGVRASHQDAFQSIVGEVRIIPVFENVAGSGSNTSYKIVRWAGVRIVHVDFGGSPKQILVQPADVWLDKDSVIQGTGTQSSNSVFSKPKIVQ